MWQNCQNITVLSNVANIVDTLRLFQNCQEKMQMLQSLQIGQYFENIAVIPNVADITEP